MESKEIKNYAVSYISNKMEQNPNWLDQITDSWIDDAEDWFVYNNKNITIEDSCVFRQHVRKRFNVLYDKKYGERDAKYCLQSIGNDVVALLEKYNSIKHHFKKFNAYTEAVTYQFEELKKHLQLLDNIENYRVESLKEKEG